MTTDYQTIVYDICNLLDAASTRSVSRGTGVVVDGVVSEVKALIADRYSLRAQVADLTRHAEAMATASEDNAGSPLDAALDLAEAVAAYRLATP